MVKIRQMLLNSAKYSLKSPYQIKPQFITIHNTANDASANNEARYHNSNNNQVSFHYAVDDKEIVQVIPDNRNAWHCGDGRGNGNMKSIGIEICYSKSGGARYEKAENQAVELTAYLLHKYNLPTSAVKQHHHWSRKNCPHRIRANGTWESFLNRVQKALNKINGANIPNTPKVPHRIKSGVYSTKEEANKAASKVVSNKLASEKYITIIESNGKYAFQTGSYSDKLTAEKALQRMKDLKILWNGHLIKA